MRLAALCVALLLAGCGSTVDAPPQKRVPVRDWIGPEQVILTAADGVKVYGRSREAIGEPKALILLFHQAGSSKDEYADIQRRLAAARYASLAIDQRSGGDLFGPNETVKALGHQGSYVEAKSDLEAALAWSRSGKLPVILWGSSYSASLAFLVAADHPGVAALLAFSPDEYFDGKPSVREAAHKLVMPVFVTSAQDSKEIAAARALLNVVPGDVRQQFVPVHGGVHGSSTLIAPRNSSGTEEAWTAVLAFLDKVTRR